MAMENFGIDNVRGYCWTKTESDLNNYPQIKEMLTTDKINSMGMLAVDFLEKNQHLIFNQSRCRTIPYQVSLIVV